MEARPGQNIKAIFGAQTETEAGITTCSNPVCQGFLIYCTDKCFGQSEEAGVE